MRNLLAPAALALFLVRAGSSFAADDTFEVNKTDASGTVGAKTKASVTITARKGWHLNHEAPLTLKLAPAPGILLDKPKLARGDLALSSETEARFEVGMTLSEPGKNVIEAEAGFVLCQKDACRPVKEKLTLTTLASEPKATPAATPGKKKQANRPRRRAGTAGDANGAR
jgi:hypothetical protein